MVSSSYILHSRGRTNLEHGQKTFMAAKNIRIVAESNINSDCLSHNTLIRTPVSIEPIDAQ